MVHPTCGPDHYRVFCSAGGQSSCSTWGLTTEKTSYRKRRDCYSQPIRINIDLIDPFNDTEPPNNIFELPNGLCFSPGVINFNFTLLHLRVQFCFSIHCWCAFEHIKHRLRVRTCLYMTKSLITECGSAHWAWCWRAELSEPDSWIVGWSVDVVLQLDLS